MYVEFYPKRTITTEHTFGKMTLKEDESYIFHDSWVGSIPGNVSLLDNRFRQYNINMDCNDKSILFLRTAGGGDMLFLSAIINYIKVKYPKVTIDFCCIEEQSEIAKLILGVDNVLPMPLNSKDFHKYDFHFEISGLIEHNDINSNTNVYDVLFQHLGIEDCSTIEKKYKKPYIKTIERYDIKEKTIGIHPFANDNIRQLDIGLINLVIDKLIMLGYFIIIFSSKEEKEIYSPFFHKNVIWTAGKSFSDITNMLSSLELVICSDSLFLHLCQAIGVHTLSIHGPFSSESRVKYYTNLTYIDTFPDCRCSLHGVGKCPKGFNNSPCLNIDPDMIVNIALNKTAEFKKSINSVLEVKSFNLEKTNVEN